MALDQLFGPFVLCVWWGLEYIHILCTHRITMCRLGPALGLTYEELDERGREKKS